MKNRNKSKIQLKIRDLSHEGLGIGVTVEGKVYFIPDALPGETVIASPINKHEAQLIERVETSTNRIQPKCPLFSACGACHMQHTHYESTLEWKWKRVYDCFSRITKLNEDAIKASASSPMAKASPDIWQYRNNARFHIEAVEGNYPKIGFYKRRANEIVDQGEHTCWVISPFAEQVKQKLRQFLIAYPVSEVNAPQMMQVRNSEATKQAIITLFFPHLNAIDTKTREIWTAFSERVKQTIGDYEQSLLLNFGKQLNNQDKIIGRNYYQDNWDGLMQYVEASAFSQVNAKQSTYLSHLLPELLKQNSIAAPKIVWDIYGGTGSLGLAFAKAGAKINVLELHDKAKQYGLLQAEANGVLENYEFFLGDASETIKTLKQTKQAPDLVITDPPRQGLSESLIETLREVSATNWIYVSCDPASLARDLRPILDGGYELMSWEVLDMFPWTGHVESVVLMSRA